LQAEFCVLKEVQAGAGQAVCTKARLVFFALLVALVLDVLLASLAGTLFHHSSLQHGTTDTCKSLQHSIPAAHCLVLFPSAAGADLQMTQLFQAAECAL